MNPLTEQRRIDVAVCTYRRAHIVETLKSLARVNCPAGLQMRIIVADNDATPGAREVVERAAQEDALDVHYIHAPSANISIARNACLDTAKAPLLAFIDDDETVSSTWLTALVETLEREQADVVLGPVDAVYAPDAPRWMRAANIHSTRPVWVDGRIVTGYCGNVLMRREAPSILDRRFDVNAGVTGGEDTLFLSAVSRSGGRIAYAPDALVLEPVPQERATMRWLLARRLRCGRTHGQTMAATGLRRVALSMLSAAKTAILILGAGFNLLLLRSLEARRSLLRATFHCGVLRTLLARG